MRAPSPAELVTRAAVIVYLPLAGGLGWAVGHGEYQTAMGWLVALIAAAGLPFLLRALHSRDEPVTVVARGGPPTVHPTPSEAIVWPGYQPEQPAVSGPDG